MYNTRVTGGAGVAKAEIEPRSAPLPLTLALILTLTLTLILTLTLTLTLGRAVFDWNAFHEQQPVPFNRRHLIFGAHS